MICPEVHKLLPAKDVQHDEGNSFSISYVQNQIQLSDIYINGYKY